MNSIIRWILQTEIGRRIELQALMYLVTSSLRLPNQNILCIPSAQTLDIFASFTANYLGECKEVQQQTLHAKAILLGKRLRRCLTRRDSEALTQLTFLLYRNIGINMEGEFPGEVVVSKCHFCNYYSPNICSIASLMDSGVICGLFGGGELAFHKRITEGNAYCLCELRNHKTDNS